MSSFGAMLLGVMAFWLLSPTLAGELAKNSSLSVQKTAQLGRMATAGNSYVIQFDVNTYKEFVIDRQRPYNIFVLYTAPETMCPPCRDVESAFKRIAREVVVSGSYKGAKDRLPVMFGSIDVAKYNSVASLHGMETVPRLVFIGQTSLTKSNKGLIMFKSEDVLQAVAEYEKDFLRFIREKSGRNIELSQSSRSVFASLCLIALFVSIGLVVLFKSVKLIQKFPILMVVAAMVTQALSTSGFFFSVQHGMKMFGYDQKSRTIITFAPGSRNQFMVEGLLMAGCSVMFGLSLVASVFTPTLKLARSTSNSIVFLLFIVSVSLYQWIFFAYYSKSGFGSAGFLPPEGSIMGSLDVDRQAIIA